VEEHVLIAVGKVAGIGGLGFGIFFLLFREVIRKNIFPRLSDQEAYQLIRQFMYLTFGMAVLGLGAWIFLSTKTAVENGHHHSKRLAPSPDISGTWTGKVKYSWGDTYNETFTFEINGHQILGSASYVTGSTAIHDGIIDGSRLAFQTISFTEVNEKRYKETHRYRGTVEGDDIQFVLETDSDYNSPPPISFTMHRRSSQ